MSWRRWWWWTHFPQQQPHLHFIAIKTWYASFRSTCCLYLVTRCLYEEYFSINFLLLPAPCQRCTMSTSANPTPAPIFTRKSRNSIIEKQVTEAHAAHYSEGMPVNELYKIIWGTRRFVEICIFRIPAKFRIELFVDSTVNESFADFWGEWAL